MKLKQSTISIDKGKKQSAEIYRKIGLRKMLLSKAGEGAVYVPFCGEGDPAVALYKERDVFAADIDEKKTDVFRERLPDAVAQTGDCDIWPFFKYQGVGFSVADFDAQAYPYDSFHAFWRGATKEYPLVMFFTDGQLGPLTRYGNFRTPEGEKVKGLSLVERRKLRNFYWRKVVLPWFQKFCEEAELRIVRTKFYIAKDGRMIYWGAVVDRKEER